MRIFVLATMLLLLTGAAHAQNSPLPGSGKTNEVPPDKNIDRAYRDAISRIPEPKVIDDPWGNVRNTGTPQNSKKKSSSDSR